MDIRDLLEGSNCPKKLDQPEYDIFVPYPRISCPEKDCDGYLQALINKGPSHWECKICHSVFN